MERCPLEGLEIDTVDDLVRHLADAHSLEPADLDDINEARDRARANLAAKVVTEAHLWTQDRPSGLRIVTDAPTGGYL